MPLPDGTIIGHVSIAEQSHSPIDWGAFSRGRIFSKDTSKDGETV